MISWIRRALPPSGGLFYHYLALRFSRTLWQPFKQDVAQWLQLWKPQARELIIFGSSAGYSLPPDFMNQFERVVAVEPDPFARLLFKRRFPKGRIEFAPDRDLLAPLPKDFPGSSSQQALKKLRSFLDRYPNAAILFANVLGQLPLEFPHLSDELFASHLIGVRAAVKNRPWASYHDLLSTWARPKSRKPFVLPAGDLDLTEFALKHLEILPNTNVNMEVTDHQTHPLSAGEPTLCSWWELAPGRYHLIGFLHSSKPI
jgi:hypothetical protein